MASTSVSLSYQTSGIYLDWSIYGMGNPFNTDYYLEAGISTRRVTEGSSSISGVLDSVSARSSGSSTSVSGMVDVSDYSDGERITVYGFAQSANGRYYGAGSDSVTVNLAEYGEITSFSVSSNGSIITARWSAYKSLSSSYYRYRLYYRNTTSGGGYQSISVSGSSSSYVLTVYEPGEYELFLEMYMTNYSGSYPISTSATRYVTVVINYGEIATFVLSDDGGVISADFSFSGLTDSANRYQWIFYYKYSTASSYYNVSGPGTTLHTEIPVDTTGTWNCMLELYYLDYSTTMPIDTVTGNVYITVLPRPDNWSWANTITINGRSMSRVIAAGNAVPTFQAGITKSSVTVRTSPSSGGSSMGTLSSGQKIWIYSNSGGYYYILYGSGWGYVPVLSVELQAEYRAYYMSAAEWQDFQERINEFRTYKRLGEYDFGTIASGYDMEEWYAVRAKTAIEDMGVSAPAIGSAISASFINGLATALNSVR